MFSLADVLAEEIPNAHYVGGIVRSSLLNRFSSDIDIALPASEIKQAAARLAKRLNAAVFEMDPELGVWRLVTHQEKIQLDLTAYQGANLKEDLLRRDFAFNALAYPVSARPEIVVMPRENDTAHLLLKGLQNNLIVDECDGITDIKKKLIRLNGPHHFQEDPLRMLRAFRSAAELNFTIDSRTLAQIKTDHALIVSSAGERVREELERLLATSKSYEMIKEMDQCGLLTSIFPELEAQRTCAEVYYGKGGVLKHTLYVLKRMEYLLEHLEVAFPKYASALIPFTKNKALYKMAALLHDIAKPTTAKIQGDRLRFFYHEQKGAQMAKVVLDRLHYSRADIRLICSMIGEHLRPSNLASNNVLTDRGIYHFFRDLKEAAIPMLLLCWADYTSYITEDQLQQIIPRTEQRLMTIEQAKREKNIGKTLRHLQVLFVLFGKYFESPQKVRPTRLVTGQDVMLICHLPPCPRVGEILEAVSIAQVEGEVTSREEALTFLQQTFCTKK